MLIAIDHGNKLIKTANKIFSSGLSESTTRPYGNEILKYKGNYYAVSDTRIPYLRDKTVDDRFYILTLFAIAYEIEAAGCYAADEIIDVQLLIGLPPAHYGLQREKFEKHFVRNTIEAFEFCGKHYEIYINKAFAYPQALAAVMPIYNSIRGFSKVTVVDIGGFTADYLLIKNGRPDTETSDSLENGVIIFYDRIIGRINSEFNLLLNEADIDAILSGNFEEYGENVTRMVMDSAQTFVNDLFSKLRERMIDLRTGKTVFVGGGSILLKKQIEASGKVGAPIFMDKISANAEGYITLYYIPTAGRRSV